MKQITTKVFKYLVIKSLAEPTILMEQSGSECRNKCSGLHFVETHRNDIMANFTIHHNIYTVVSPLPTKSFFKIFCGSPVLFEGATVCLI